VTQLTSTMNTGQDSAFEDPTETTPVEVANQTTGSSATSPSSRGAGFYFQCAVLNVGVVGATANGVVLYALTASRQHKKHVLIFSQNVMDLVDCLSLAEQYAVLVNNCYLTGTSGYWICLMLLGNYCSSAAYTMVL